MNSVRITRSGAICAVAAVSMALAGRVFGLVEGFVAASVLAIVLGASAISVSRQPLRIGVRRTLRPARLPIDSACRVDLSLRNVAGKRTGVVQISDRVGPEQRARLQLAPLAAGATREMLYRLPVHRRGIVTFGPLELVALDPFGLWARRNVIASHAEVIVLPRSVELAPLPPAVGDEPESLGETNRTMATATEEFSSLREYVEGDDVRRIHWPSTARRGSPVVRHYDEPWQRRVTVIVDLRSERHDHDSFERAMSAAASVLQSCSSSDQLVRMLTTSGEDTGFIGTRQGLDAAIDLLAGAEPSASGSLTGIHRALMLRPTGGTVVTINGSLPGAEQGIASAIGDLFGLTVGVWCRGVVELRRSISVDFSTDESLQANWNTAVARIELRSLR